MTSDFWLARRPLRKEKARIAGFRIEHPDCQAGSYLPFMSGMLRP